MICTEAHGVWVANLILLIGSYLRRNPVGRVGIRVDYSVHGPEQIDVTPDVSVRLVEKDAPVVTQGPVPQMPDFAIEIQSPDDKLLTLREKALFYLDHGCQMVWLVLTRPHLVEVYRAGHDVRIFTLDETLDGGDMLPGFTLPVAEIFAM